MNRPLSIFFVFVLSLSTLLNMNNAMANNQGKLAATTLTKTSVERQDDRRKERRIEQKKHFITKSSLKAVAVKTQPHYRRPVVVVPRKRHFGNILVVRTYGNAYIGYGHHHTDNDAWKWLAFTAISLKILDNIDEQAQREHEAAQIEATKAPIGQAITWETESGSGSVIATKQGTNVHGQVCREFQQTVTIGNESEQAYGTACLQDDGSWKMI